MIIKMDWYTFNQKYMNTHRIFVKEQDDSWEMYTSEDMFIIRCKVDKYAEQSENMMFIERYFTHRPNIIKVEDIIGYEEEKPEEVELFEAISNQEALPEVETDFSDLLDLEEEDGV